MSVHTSRSTLGVRLIRLFWAVLVTCALSFPLVGTGLQEASARLKLAPFTPLPTAPASITEEEPNDTPATAKPLGTTPVRVRGDLFKVPFTPGGDVDVYSFTAAAGDRVYAATMTGFSGGTGNSVIEIVDVNGTTQLEADNDDGAVGALASNVAGTLLVTGGTYYIRVKQVAFSDPISPYDLYVRVLSGAPTPETEPNDGVGGEQALAANGWMSGTISSPADDDRYAFAANAGDTIVAILDLDPERDAPEWDGILRIGIFNGYSKVVNGSGVGGAADDATPSEALFMTVKTTGTYQVSVAGNQNEGPTATYHLSVSVIPGNSDRACTTYTGGSTGAITDGGTTNFVVAIPDSKLIDHLQLRLNASHSDVDDLDVSLISPDGTEVVLFDDPSSNGPAPQLDVTLDDEAGIPISVFTNPTGMKYTPEAFARMAYFRGMQAQGTWTLRIHDDVPGDTGTLNSWALIICQEPVPSCTSTTTIISTDFEADDAGFTHSGVQDEWERGLPGGVSSPIITCRSGTNCWKTDLNNTYNASANYDLLSPAVDLTAYTGTPVTLSWWQKYQMESATFDRFWVEVREVGNPPNARKVFEWKGDTQTRSVGNPATTVNMSAGWGLVKADISSFAGLSVEVRYHVETNATVQLSGLAIDDFSVTACPVVAATLAAPSGTIPTQTPTYTWNKVGQATWYYLWVENAARTAVIKTWYEASTVCGATTCSVTPPTAVANSDTHLWWIQTYFSSGYGPWSNYLTFTPTVASPAAGLIAPTGTVPTQTPTYSWTKVNTATWYYLWVENAARTAVIKTWYEAATVCGATTCAVTPQTILASDQVHLWWIQTYFPSAYGPWSTNMTFTPSVAQPATTLVSPSGATSPLTPTYTWDKVPSSTWYYLWVANQAGTPVIQTWYESSTVCGATTCSVTPSTPLASGQHHHWWIQTYFPTGYGPWSNSLLFTPSP